MTYRPAPGVVAPKLCRHCRRALWWRHGSTDVTPVLVDVENRRRCRPLARFGDRLHALPIERIAS